MAGEIITVRLSRVDAQPWGFRLQGGKDFGTPLLIQKVNSGSLADQVGLVAGDSVLRINNTDVFTLRHKEAQDAVVRGGNSFEICVQRGGSTWAPSVTPIGPSPTQYGHSSPVTRTSLAHRPQDIAHIGTGYNNSARPFLNGSGPVKSIVNKQYNTPVSMYSDETIAETLSAQAEVLAGGVLGVNFKKNEKMYNSANSEVYKMLQEQANEPEEPADQSDHHYAPQPQHPHSQYQQPQVQSHQSQLQSHQSQVQSHQSHAHSQAQSQSHVTKHVTAPIDRPIAPTAGLPPGQNICSECERLIVGVFVRVKDKNLHAECFKCATCGSSLKNQGYYNVNNKLYCDVHAKMAALSKPPPGTAGLKPVALQTDARLGASAITAALNARAANVNGGSPQLIAPSLYNPQVYNTNHELLYSPTHSRTSSSASSTGLPFTNSSNSNKTTPTQSTKSSPTHSRENSLTSPTSSNFSLRFQEQKQQFTNFELEKNDINQKQNIINNNNNNNNNSNNNSNFINNNNNNNNNNNLINNKYNTYNGKNSIYGTLPKYQAKIMDIEPTIVNSETETDSIITNGFYENNKNNNYGLNDKENGTEPIYGTILPKTKKKPFEEFQYKTLNGGTIRTVHPPGKGVKVEYKVNSNIGGPKPYNYSSPMSPPMAAPKSPSSFPPPSNWANQPQQQHHQPQQRAPVSNYGSNTLPRQNPGQNQGHFNTFRPGNSYQDLMSQEICEILPETKTVSLSPFNWPPHTSEEDRFTPTASPLYIPPPETQHIYSKPLLRTEPVQQMAAPWLDKQSCSAPELSSLSLKQSTEFESSSDSFTSTSSTTTTTTTEDSRDQRNNNYHIMQTMPTYSDQSYSDIDFQEQELAAIQQQQHYKMSLCSAEVNQITGRRSVQESAEYISDNISTQYLVDCLKEASPRPPSPPPKPPKRVEFSEPLEKEEQNVEHSVQTLTNNTQQKTENTNVAKLELVPGVKPLPPSAIPNPVPKEWQSAMVQALTVVSDTPYRQINTPTIEIEDSEKYENKKEVIEDLCVKSDASNALTTSSVIDVKKDTVFTDDLVKGSFMSSALTTAPYTPVEFLPKPSKDPVPLPEETTPYFPPPISMQPNRKEENLRSKSPFLSALITAPDRQYSPFGTEVPNQLDDLPTPKGKLEMIDALTVAPSQSYTPLSFHPDLGMELKCYDTKTMASETVTKNVEMQQRQNTSDFSFEKMGIETQMNNQISAFANVAGVRSVNPFSPRKQSFSTTNATDSKLFSQTNNATDSKLFTQTNNSSIINNNIAYASTCTASATSTASACKQMSYQQQLNSSNTQQQYQSSSQLINTSVNNNKAQTESYMRVQNTANNCQQINSQISTSDQSQKLTQKQLMFSGLHKPETIPVYQKNLMQLPTQTPHRPPDSPQLRENVPIAFLDTPRETSPTLTKPIALNNSSSESVSYQQQQIQEQQPQKTQMLSFHNDNRSGPITMTFQSLDTDQNDVHHQQPQHYHHEQQVGSITPTRPYTPSLINKPAPTIPYYQQNLCPHECDPTEGHIFDPKSRSPSPAPHSRAKSPAPGPPPNPLRAHCPRIKERNQNAFIDVVSQKQQQQTQSNQTLSQQSMQQKSQQQQKQQQIQQEQMQQTQQKQQQIQQHQFQQTQQNQQHMQQRQMQQTQEHHQQKQQQILKQQQQQMSQLQQKLPSNYQVVKQSAAGSFYESPEIIKQKQIGNLNIQTKLKESQMNQQKRSEMQSANTTNIDNTQIQRRTRVVEEFERTQSAKSMEILKTSGCAINVRKASVDQDGAPRRGGFVANQMRRLSGVDQEISAATNQMQTITSAASASKSRSESKQSTMQNSEQRTFERENSPFPKSPDPTDEKSSFPIRNFHPYSVEENLPKFSLPSRAKHLGTNKSNQPTNSSSIENKPKNTFNANVAMNTKPINKFETEQQAQKLIQSVTLPNALPSKPKPYTPGVPVPAFKSQEIPTKIDFKPNQSTTISAYKPTPTSGPGFKQPKTTPSAVVSDPSPASAGSSNKGGKFGATFAPRRGRGTLNKAVGPGARVPLCGSCNTQVSI